MTRTLLAACDRGGCDASISLDPWHPQPLHLLADAGWGFDLLCDGPPTFCPKHKATS